MPGESHNQKNKVKQLKVLPKYFDRAYRQTVIFPEIRLAGKWLQDIGFACGQHVTVLQEQNKITITIEPPAAGAEETHP